MKNHRSFQGGQSTCVADVVVVLIVLNERQVLSFRIGVVVLNFGRFYRGHCRGRE